MQFRPGQSGNPMGRPKGTVGGRAQALAQLDKLLATKESKDILRAALRAELHKNPVSFFKTMVMPLLPKEPKAAVVNAPTTIEWKSLIETDATPPPDARAAQEA